MRVREVDEIVQLIAELFRLRPELEEVALRKDQHDNFSIDLTLPKNSPLRASIIHTPHYDTFEAAFDHARQLMMPRADAA